MAIKVTNVDQGIAIIEPRGSLIGGNEIDELKVTARDLLEKGNKKLLIDLHGVDYINSSGIGALVSILTTYKNSNGVVKLCRMGKGVQNIFVITKLTSVFDVEDTREAAMKKFTP